MTHIQGVSTIFIRGAHRPEVHRQALSPTHVPQTHTHSTTHRLRMHTKGIHLPGTQRQHVFCPEVPDTHSTHTHTHTHTQVLGEHTDTGHTLSPPLHAASRLHFTLQDNCVIRSSHKGRVTDGDKSAGKKTAMHRYLKKRRVNTSNLRKANHFIWEVYKKKKKNHQAIFN